MQIDTETHQFARFRLALYKTLVNVGASTSEVGEFERRNFELHRLYHSNSYLSTAFFQPQYKSAEEVVSLLSSTQLTETTSEFLSIRTIDFWSVWGAVRL